MTTILTDSAYIRALAAHHDGSTVPEIVEHRKRLDAIADRLAAPKAPSGQQAEQFLEVPDVEDESGINTHYSRELVLQCIDAALAGQQSARPAPAGQAVGDGERLDWLDGNGRKVKYSSGYLGAKDGWCWTDERGFHHDAANLREAIDAASQTERPSIKESSTTEDGRKP